MKRIGIDIGSTYTKYCVWDTETGALELCSERTPIRQREYFAEKLDALRGRYEGCTIVTCGYGRKNIAYDKTVTELTALALGAHRQCPGVETVLDIGGQDTKIIRQESGKLKAFFVNDKCAAGCGLFLGNVCNLLQTPFAEIDLTRAEETINLSSVCAVFAQSEIVELIAGGASEKAIVQAVVRQILVQAKALLGKVDCEEIVLSGGLTQICGIREMAEQVLERRVIVPKHGSYLSAIGCAVWLEG